MPRGRGIPLPGWRPSVPAMPRLDDLMRTVFDARTLERGQAYAGNDHVVDVRLRDGRLRAVVEGQDTYEVGVTLDGLHLGKDHIAADDLEGDCSCPIGLNCKHAVAALIAWAASQGRTLDLQPPANVKTTPATTADGTPVIRLLNKPWVGDREQQTWLAGLTSRVGAAPA